MILIDILHRVEEQCFRVHRILLVVTVLVVNFSVRRHGLGHQEVNTATIAVVADDVAVGTDLQIVGHVGIDIHTEGVTLVVEAFQYTLLAHVVTRDEIFHLLGTTINGDVVILDDTSLRCEVVEPVGLFAGSLILGFVGILHIVIKHCLTRVLCSRVLITLSHLRTIGEVKLLGKVFNTEVAVVAHRRLTVLTVLGGNQNNTIGTVRTVDSGSRGILQDFHGLDIVGVDIVERTATL